jgi:hypothetical protein
MQNKYDSASAFDHACKVQFVNSQLSQAPLYRSCPLSCLSLGPQPTLQLFSSDIATELPEAFSSAKGLLPLAAFLVASIHQVRFLIDALCM